MQHILVAEDTSHMLRLLEMTLQKGNYAFTSYKDGISALQAIQDEKPVLAILDVMMPGMDGLEVLAKMKQDAETSSIPVIVLTARGQSLTRKQAEQSGASAFVTKPFSPNELLKTIANLINESP